MESQHTQIQIQTQIPITTHTQIQIELSDEPIRASSLASMRSAVGSQQIQIQINTDTDNNTEAKQTVDSQTDPSALVKKSGKPTNTNTDRNTDKKH